ncbi:MAG: SEL1-like repeat protein [Geminicoccaceae bacterium]|nr:SEL1-like repeat protein [Geminicoccaceae bacterium]
MGICILAASLVACLGLARTAPAEAGFAEGYAAYESGDYSTAFREWLPLAQTGDRAAQYNIGLLYDFGNGVPQDYTEAARWYRRAAEQGDATAQFNLGLMYARGEGVPENDAEAVKWYRRAAEQDNAQAQFNLGNMYRRGEGVPRNDAEAVRWYRHAAEQDYASAQLNLGFMYDFGEGVPENDAEAVRWYRRAADKGNATAQSNLGTMYRRGEGVPKNAAEAVRWYRRAAQQGSASAQNNLGVMYEDGLGVPADWMEAHFWYNLAAAGYPSGGDRDQAVRNRDRVQARLSREQIARAQARARAWRPKAEDATSGAIEPVGQHAPSAASQVREVQSLLGSLGYDTGPVDGIMGQKTRAAIRGFQEVAGLSVDGNVTEVLVAALRFAHAVQSAPAAIAPERELAATGSGFAVTLDGLVLTNEHVVTGCGELRLRPPEGGLTVAAGLLALDPTNDLALLQAPVSFAASAVFRDGRGIRAGDGVVVVGHPLRGLLADEASVTTGAVSALAGLRNDARYLQLTAPVQPGNSGGPLVDMSGRVVGVVVAKLDAMKVADATGDIPQNVNFAVKAAIARSFLDANDVAYASAPAEGAMSAADVGAAAKAMTVLVECWR